MKYEVPRAAYAARLLAALFALCLLLVPACADAGTVDLAIVIDISEHPDDYDELEITADLVYGPSGFAISLPQHCSAQLLVDDPSASEYAVALRQRADQIGHRRRIEVAPMEKNMDQDFRARITVAGLSVTATTETYYYEWQRHIPEATGMTLRGLDWEAEVTLTLSGSASPVWGNHIVLNQEWPSSFQGDLPRLESRDFMSRLGQWGLFDILDESLACGRR